MATLQHQCFMLAVSLIEKAIRIFGKSFYFKFVPRLVEEIDLIYPVEAGCDKILFYCPGEIVRVRAQMLLTKEPDTIEWINGFQEGDVLLDIGANIGVYTLYAAVTRRVTVVAIEPSPHNYSVLCRNIFENGVEKRCVPLCMACDEHTDVKNIFMSEHGLKPGGTGNAVGVNLDNRGESFDVKMQYRSMVFAPDDLFEKFDLPFPNHLKLDIDTVQLGVIRGAKKILSDPRLKSALIEMPDTDVDHPAIFEVMKRAGLEFVGESVSNHYFSRPE